jgi:D-glycero-D-manno-heptose 1,7-bisphosphate phosphatase
VGDRQRSGALTRAIFLDRDGVLNEVVPDPLTGTCESPTDAAAVSLAPGAAEGVRQLGSQGFRIVVVSNQPGAAKGSVTRAALDEVHAAVVAALAAEGAHVDDWRYCFHHPQAGDACACRKPEPGLLLDAARELGLALDSSWMIGDADTDVAAGRAAGCRTALVLNPRSAHRRNGAEADVTAATLADAARVILSDRSG